MLRTESITVNGTVYPCSKVNLIIGANNSGKTTFLNQLFNSLVNRKVDQQIRITEIEMSLKNTKRIVESLIPNFFQNTSLQQIPSLGRVTTKIATVSGLPWDEQIFNLIKMSDNRKRNFKIETQDNTDRAIQFFTALLVGTLESCSNRLQLKFSTKVDQLTAIPEDPIGHLFRDKDILLLVSKNIYETFGIKIGFDNLIQGEKHLRILPNQRITLAPDSVEAASAWEQQSKPIEGQGDGIKAYIRLALSLIQPSKHIIFIDEPETFLHPPQRRALGSLISELVKQGNKQVFISTHDPEILRGILNTTLNDVRIFNLIRENDNFDLRVIERQRVNSIIQQSSQLLAEKLLNSFFYKTTILCEDESDRVFYENASATYFWNLFQNANFIGLNGHGQAKKTFEHLKKIDLNARLVVDIDFALDGILPTTITVPSIKTEFTQVKRLLAAHLGNRRLREQFKKNGVDYFKTTNTVLYNRLANLLENLKIHGVFIVPVGEVESWTNTNKGELTLALNIIYITRKVRLRRFLKDILT